MCVFHTLPPISVTDKRKTIVLSNKIKIFNQTFNILSYRYVLLCVSDAEPRPAVEGRVKIPLFLYETRHNTDCSSSPSHLEILFQAIRHFENKIDNTLRLLLIQRL